MKMAVVFIGLLFLMAVAAMANPQTCATIKDGTITDSKTQIISVGYDQWGYNYQAHMYKGWSDNADRPTILASSGDQLMMNWNDAWLSNKDCGWQIADGTQSAGNYVNYLPSTKLDRHYPLDSYAGSGAWLTNRQSGSYEQDGQTCRWHYYVKIVAAPADAYIDGVNWYTADGIEIGPVILGAFAIIKELSNDPCAGYTGHSYYSP